ncbi:MAG TPA: NCS1 family nucleobase:cation symporter-1 [Victivallales bacterium]|nr:NCS1 family nucleobase:cation symporter-1 [Victivallales bacterium]
MKKLLREPDILEIQKFPNNYSNDTKPLEFTERNWSMLSIANLWIGIIVSIPVYMLASGLIASGMSWWEALITVVLGHTIVIIPSVLLGHCGTKYGISYPMLSKLIFGINGNILPTLIRALLGIFWFSIQCWIGGEAVNTILQTIIPAFNYSFISFAIFIIINLYIAYTGNTALKNMANYAAPVLIILGVIVIIWGYTVSGGFIELFSGINTKSTGNFWSYFLPALSAMIAFDSTIAINFSDFTRNVTRQRQQVLGQFLGAPFITAFIVFVGICGTSASIKAFGSPIWNPAVLVSKFDSPLIRIGFSFFILLATLTTNVVANLIPPGIIINNLLSKFISYKKAIIIVCLLAIFIQPWNILSNPSNYIYSVLGGFATFLGPMTGIYLAGYWIEYKTDINLVDLYKNTNSIYNYTRGINLPATFILIVTTLFLFNCKYIHKLEFFYNNAYLLGLISAMIIYIAIKKINILRKA